MAIVDLRYAASLAKIGFSADEIRQVIGLKGHDEQPQETEAEQVNEVDESSDTTESEENAQEETQEKQGTEPENEVIDQPKQPEKPKENPLTRNEAPRKESLVSVLAKLL